MGPEHPAKGYTLNNLVIYTYKTFPPPSAVGVHGGAARWPVGAIIRYTPQARSAPARSAF